MAKRYRFDFSKEEKFIKEFIKRCEKYDLGLQSDDPYCGLNIVPYEEVSNYYKSSDSFGRWGWKVINQEINDDELD